MPIYEFKCSVCGEIQEELRKIDEREESAYCTICSNEAVKIPTSPAGINGGSHEHYRHRSGKKSVWKTDMGPQGKIGKEWYGDNPHADSSLEKKK